MLSAGCPEYHRLPSPATRVPSPDRLRGRYNRAGVSFPRLPLASLVFSLATLSPQSSDLAALERAAAASPADLQAQRRLAAAYETAGRRLDAVAAWARVTELAPAAPSGW